MLFRSNEAEANYRFQSFNGGGRLNNTRDIAVSQVGVTYHGSLGGGNVSTNTELRNGIPTGFGGCHSGVVTSNEARMFLTVPNLRRGFGNSSEESALRAGENGRIINDNDWEVYNYPSKVGTQFLRRDPQSNDEMTSHAYELSFDPVTQEMQDVLNGADQRFMEKQCQGWVRGGISSKDMSKDTNEYVTMDGQQNLKESLAGIFD